MQYTYCVVHFFDIGSANPNPNPGQYCFNRHFFFVFLDFFNWVCNQAVK